MRDLFDQISQNNLDVLGRRRKPNKGSRLARFALTEALGGDGADIYEFSTKKSKILENIIDEDGEFEEVSSLEGE